MTLQQLYEQTPPQQRALQFGVDGGDALTGAFPQKRVVHAGLHAFQKTFPSMAPGPATHSHMA